MNYRIEIDGLRALAVLPVVLYHAGVKSISGGFLGVDVFFVISGDNIEAIQKGEFVLGPSHHIVNTNKLQSQEEIEQDYYRSFEALVTVLLQYGKKVIIVGPIPELPIDMKKIFTPLTIFHGRVPDEVLSTDWRFQYQRSGYIDDWLKGLSEEHEQVLYLSSSLPFCNDVKCASVVNGQSLYFDDDHLSLEGSLKYIKFFEAQLGSVFTSSGKIKPDSKEAYWSFHD